MNKVRNSPRCCLTVLLEAKDAGCGDARGTVKAGAGLEFRELHHNENVKHPEPRRIFLVSLPKYQKPVLAASARDSLSASVLEGSATDTRSVTGVSVTLHAENEVRTVLVGCMLGVTPTCSQNGGLLKTLSPKNLP